MQALDFNHYEIWNLDHWINAEALTPTEPSFYVQKSDFLASKPLLPWWEADSASKWKQISMQGCQELNLILNIKLDSLSKFNTHDQGTNK